MHNLSVIFIFLFVIFYGIGPCEYLHPGQIAVWAWMWKNHLHPKTKWLWGLGHSDLRIFHLWSWMGLHSPFRGGAQSGGPPGLAVPAQMKVAAVARKTFTVSSHVPVVPGVLQIVIHALVTFQLDYCNAVCMELPLKTTWNFQLVQNTMAQWRACFNMPM